MFAPVRLQEENTHFRFCAAEVGGAGSSDCTGERGSSAFLFPAAFHCVFPISTVDAAPAFHKRSHTFAFAAIQFLKRRESPEFSTPRPDLLTGNHRQQIPTPRTTSLQWVSLTESTGTSVVTCTCCCPFLMCHLIPGV